MMQDTRRQTATAAPAEDDTIDLLALGGALWRGKFTILFAALVAALLSAYYAFFVAVPIYESSTTLALELETSPISADIESLFAGMSTESEALNTELEVLQSRGILRQLVDELELTSDPEFNAALQPEPAFSISDLTEGVVPLVLGPMDEVLAPDPEMTELNSTIDAVRDAISVRNLPQTYVFNISVTTESSEKSQLMANTLAEIYIADQVNQKFQATETAVTWLSERVSDLEVELRERENELKSVRTEIDLISIEGLEALNRQLIDARERAANAAASAAVAEARLSRIAELEEAGDYVELARIIGDPTLSRLVENDAGIEQIEARIETLRAQAQTAFERQNLQAETLQAAVERLEGDVAAQSDDLVQLQQIEREVQAIRTLYETFLTRLKEATVQRGLAQSDSRVLSEAIPGTYVAPQRLLILLIAINLGLIIGIAIVLARQFLSRGFRSADELESETGQPILGQIPLMPIKRRDQLITFLNEKPASAGAEAIRNLRTSILLSSSGGPPKVIMSTSSLPGEGKTTQAIALAHNLSSLNKKVLLIEGDVRRRTLNEYFRNDITGAGGIVSALSKEARIEELSEVIVRDPRLDVDIILGEKTRKNAADLFASDNFARFLDMLRQHYDYIVIDTPPVLVVPDARVIGQHVDTIVFSVAWDRTSRVQLKEALRQFKTVNLDIGGLVLSQISPSGMKRYGYGGKYGSYAAYGSKYYDT
ncbi:polysaccharide biosynthesis tyrosine autokinase [Palleronia sp.]|uniref:polysaccharide biosynthesis tyrosine autokinase n=1 Tax=Palleronia sp. TaxID=1940284 RepID=UPI0035C80ECF